MQIDLKKVISLKKIRNHYKPSKLQQNITIRHKFTYQGAFKKVAHAVRNSELFRILSKKL